MSNRLKGKKALVTGSTNGIGKAIAIAMAAEGATVIISGRNQERGQQLVEQIRATGGQAEFVAADLNQGTKAVTALASEAREKAGGAIDILVNNAAFLLGLTSTVETTEALIEEALRVNVTVPILLMGALVPDMLEQKKGIVINMGSINGLVGMPHSALYSSSKAAVHALSKAWAAEYGPQGIRVNTVAPGPTLTDIVAQHREHIETLLPLIPSRQLSKPEDVAAAVVFLASDDAANIHGATLSVDGGFTAL